MTERVKIGILGGGGILHAHGPALNACRDLCTVTAVAEANPALADAIRGFFGPDVRILPDYR